MLDTWKGCADDRPTFKELLEVLQAEFSTEDCTNTSQIPAPSLAQSLEQMYVKAEYLFNETIL